jgi:uncharacterized protein YciI
MWFICLRKKKEVQPPDARKVPLDEHLAWMRRQHEAGTVLFSGPSPQRGLGIYIIRAATRDEAIAIVSTDPYIVAGQCEFDLIDWDVRQVLGAGPFTSADIEKQTSRPPAPLV